MLFVKFVLNNLVIKAVSLQKPIRTTLTRYLPTKMKNYRSEIRKISYGHFQFTQPNKEAFTLSEHFFLKKVFLNF